MYALGEPEENPILGARLFALGEDRRVFMRKRRAALNLAGPGQNAPNPRQMHGPGRDSTNVRPRSRGRRWAKTDFARNAQP